MKKEIKIAIAVILSLWFFIMGFELGAYKERKAYVDANATTIPSITLNSTTTTQPTTTTTTNPPTTTTTTNPVFNTQPTESTSASQDNTTTENPTESTAPANDPSSLSKEQIVEKMNTYMKALKSEQNMTANKSESIVVTLVDCSVPSATSMINSIVSGAIGGDGDETISYSISNGSTSDGETPYSLIPPTNKDFALNVAGVLSAKAEKQGDNTVYTVVLVDESTTAAAPVPTYNSAVIGYLDLMSLDLPGVTITSADLKYPGSTVAITVNAQDKVINLVNKMPMSGYGAAQIAFASGNATFEGGLDETWNFTY